MSPPPALPDLAWGQTPWDKLSREDLLRHVQRLYSAVHSSVSTMKALRSADEHARYWSSAGVGGRAIAKAEQADELARGPFLSEAMYHAFYRYADDLLFAPPVGMGWAVCDLGHMTASTEIARLTCAICKHQGREAQAMRPITWADLLGST